MEWRPWIPPSETTAWLLPALMLLVTGTGYLAGWLKIRRSWRTGDTRKLFHFVIFGLACTLSLTIGFKGVNLLGYIIVAYIITMLRAGDGSIFYEGLARETDAPKRTLYIALPMCATALGGLTSYWFFGQYAACGFIVGGWGDAIGEPVGIRWGKHRYRTPNFGGGVRSERSVEGSAAVLLASFLGALIVLSFGPLAASSSSEAIWRAALIATAATLVEAISHHGTDNYTLPVTASAIAWLTA